MIKFRIAFVPLFIATTVLVGCGGGGDQTVPDQTLTDQAGDVATTAADTATDAATDAAADVTTAVAETDEAVSDAVDPAAWQDIETNWDSQISSVQEAFPDLSVEEITGTGGNPESMVSLVEQKYELSREEAQAKVSEWARSL